MKIFLINPLNFFKGYIKFPLGYFTYKNCDCRTCKNCGDGWGLMFLFFGVNFKKRNKLI